MKYILSVLLLFSYCSYGQDTIRILGHSIYPVAVTPKIDTVKVIALVSDTARKFVLDHYIELYNSDSGKICIDTLWRDFDKSVKWIIIYSVRKQFDPYTVQLAMYTPQNFMEHIEYLDENKNPLPSSTIVWMSQEIKQ